MRPIFAASMALAALAATPVAAQDSAPTTTASVYAGASAGYHDLGDNPVGDDAGAIFGGVAGVDFAVSPNVVVGVEGNFHLGTGVIDTDYGVAGRLGYKFPSGGIAYVRGGYQWVNIDVGNLVNVDIDDDDLDGVDDTADDYLLGVGGEFPLGAEGRMRLRVGVDTVGFDTWRPNAALIVGF